MCGAVSKIPKTDRCRLFKHFRYLTGAHVLMGYPRMSDYFKHALAVCESAHIGRGTRIWCFAHVLPGAVIGSDCNICDGVFIENDVRVGDRVTIKCGVQLWDGIQIEDEVFIG